MRATVTAVDFGLGGGFQAIAAVGTTTLSNVNGTYTFQATGAWTFDPNVNSSNAAIISAGFTYRITDGDGDTSTATQAIAIINNLLVVGSPSDDVTGSSADHTVPITGGPIEGPVSGGAGDDIVFGDPGSVTITPGQTANIVLVLDSSGSMTAQIPFGGPPISRMQALKDAVNALLDDLGTSGAANIRVAIIDFDTTGRAPQVFDIVVNGTGDVTEITAAKGVVNGMAASGGTNYEFALASASSWINSTGADAPLANSTFNKVMFVSDGEPTAWNNRHGRSSNFQ